MNARRRWVERLLATAGWGMAVCAALSLAVSPLRAASIVLPGDVGGGTGVQVAEPSPRPPSRPGDGSVLQGAASWDEEMVREFIGKEMKVTMAAAPVAYAGRETMRSLNAEFAKRLDALLSIYQAHGGPATAGIAPVTGGLRTSQDQFELFKQCRRIKGAAGGAGGDGSSKAHWELIPLEERCCGESHVTFLFREQDGTIISLKTPSAVSNCPVLYHRKMPDGTLWSVLGPVTMAWVSWHNLGLAVDLRDVQRDKLGNVQVILPQDQPWMRLEEAVGLLGMTWGGWWKQFPDPGHVEWHPRVRGAERFDKQSGTPLTLTDEQIGYVYRIPSTIFTWEEGAGALSVHELVMSGSWIALRSYRFLRTDSEAWEGHWYSFNPPLRLFPAYIPTIRFSRDESQWAHDIQWRGQTRVTMRIHHHRQKAATGRSSSQSFEATGTAEYRTVLEMEDWEKQANIVTHQGDSDKDQYIRMRSTSVYDVRVSIQQLERKDALTDAGRRRWNKRSQEVDEEGYTREWSDTGEPSLIAIQGLAFAWNRETGAIGETVSLVQADKQHFYDVTPTSRLWPSLPAGAADRESPPEWAPPNPRPPRPGHEPCPGCAPRR